MLEVIRLNGVLTPHMTVSGALSKVMYLNVVHDLSQPEWSMSQTTI